MTPFAVNYLRYRDKAGLTNSAVAAALGVSVHAVQGWASGKIREPDRLDDLAQLLGVTPGDLLDPGGDTPGCDVWRVCYHRPCGDIPATPFTARCGCGHDMAGLACAACAASAKPGCWTCWTERKHRCPVTVTSGIEAAA